MPTTLACISRVDIALDCSLIYSVALPDDPPSSFSFVLCRTTSVTNPAKYTIDFLWVADVMCTDTVDSGEDECSCICHPQIDYTLTIRCLGCCCCFTDEEPRFDTIPLVGCTPNCSYTETSLPGASDGYTFPDVCSGEYNDQWDICLFGSGFHFRCFELAVRNDTCCDLTYEADFTNNGLGYPATGARGTISPDDTEDLVDPTGGPGDAMCFYTSMPETTCDCDQKDAYCHRVTVLFKLTWECDEDCCAPNTPVEFTVDLSATAEIGCIYQDDDDTDRLFRVVADKNPGSTSLYTQQISGSVPNDASGVNNLSLVSGGVGCDEDIPYSSVTIGSGSGSGISGSGISGSGISGSGP
jgi:hypothetical protein